MPSFNVFRLVLVLSGLWASALGAQYTQSDSHQGVGFLKSFQHETLQDPTNGRVNYVDEDTALAKNLTFYSGDHFVIRADHTTKLSASGSGRDSVRLQSNKRYKTHVTVWNVRHMPVGCGTWPAIWEVGDNWPNEGEIDILEGVNGVSPNQATLHTSSGASSPLRYFRLLFCSPGSDKTGALQCTRVRPLNADV
ncbi:concanavalin A-like lectin/glucanase domain-containing protein [Daedaleopsis nitida]|nr:concanavalin A-like lectin/glucanase domain-containing protein [Daedaleopsis nitida]